MRRAPIPSERLPAFDAAGQTFTLPAELAHYLRDVLRMQSGGRVELFDGEGRSLTVELTSLDAESVEASIVRDTYTQKGESPCKITLVQATPKGKRWDMLLEKATELGVSRIVPLVTARTVVNIAPAKVQRKLTRWERVVAAAARQCGRSITPTVSTPMEIDDAAAALCDAPSFVCHTDGAEPLLTSLLQAHVTQTDTLAQVNLWVGPEGGFTRHEIDTICSTGGVPCSLGPRVLRSETAGITAITLTQAILGDLG